MNQAMYRRIVRTLLWMCNICLLLAPFVMYVQHRELNIDGVNVWFPVIITLATIIVPLTLAWMVYAKVKNAPVHLLAIIYLIVTAVFCVALVAFGANGVQQLVHGDTTTDYLPIIVPWTIVNAGIFTLLFGALFVCLKVGSKRPA